MSRLDVHGVGFRIDRDGAGDDLSIVTTAGDTVRVTLENGVVTGLAGPGGRSASFAYDPVLHRVDAVTDEFGGVWRYGYDELGRLACEKNPNGNVVFENEYDAVGRMRRQWDGARGGCAALGDAVDEAAPTVYAFERSETGAQTTTVTDPAGAQWVDRYDVDGRLLSSTDPTGRCTSFGFDAAGNRASVIRPSGLVVTSSFDSQGRPVTRHVRATSTQATWNCPGPVPLGGSLDEPYTETMSYEDATGALEGYSKVIDGSTAPVRQVRNVYDSSHDLVVSELVGTGGTLVPCEAGIDRCTTYTHDASGLVSSVTDARGKTTTYEWDRRGLPVSVTPAGRGTIRTDYDARGRVVWRSAPSDVLLGVRARTSFAYDDSASGDHRLTSVVDPVGARSTYEWDAAGNLVERTDAEQRAWRYEYNRFDELRHVTGPDLDRTLSYDSRGLVVAQVDAGERTTFDHDAAGRTRRVVPPRGNVAGADPDAYAWVTQYDADGRPAVVNGPEGVRLTHEYDLLGRELRSVRSHVGGAGTSVLEQRLLQYDDAERVVRTIRRAGSATSGGYVSSAQFDALGEVVVRTDERGKSWQYRYDAAGNVVRVISPEGRVSGLEYDDAGDVVVQVPPGALVDPARRTVLERSAQTGRVLRVDAPEGRDVAYAYTLAGQLASVTNGEGETTSYHYDWAGRPTGVETPDGRRTRVDYRDTDHEVVVRNAWDRATTYGLDALGRVTSKRLASGREWRWAYEPGGLVSRVTTPQGTSTICIPGDGIIRYGYDALGRRVATDYSDPQAHDVSWSWDDAGSSVVMQDGFGVETTQLDAFDRVASVTRPGHSALTQVWGADDLPVSQQVSGGTTQSFGFDDDGLLVDAAQGSRHVTLERDLDGAVVSTSRSLAGGGMLVQSLTRDAAGMVTRVKSVKGASVLYDAQVAYDDAARPVSIQRPGTPIERFSYDENGRIASHCTSAPCDAAGGVWTRYAYDRNGNRTSVTRSSGAVERFSFDVDDRLTRRRTGDEPWRALSYDPDGNLVNDGDHRYWYSQAGALTGTAAAAASVPTTTFKVSGTGERLTQTTPSSSRDLVWSSMAGDIPQVVAELDPASHQVAAQNLFSDESVLARTTPTQTLDYTASAVVGSVELVTDQSGASLSAPRYDALGASITSTTPTTDQPYGYAGERITPTTGTTHLRTREYAASLGVFTSPDPVERGLDQPYLGSYSYAEQVPTYYVDPMGTFGIPFVDTGYELEFNPMDGVRTVGAAARERRLSTRVRPVGLVIQ